MNWGTGNFGADGKITFTPGQYDGTTTGTLEEIGKSLDPAISNLGGRMESIMSTMAEKPSDPQTLALYQQVYAEYVQAMNLKVSAVSKMSQLIDGMLQKA